MNQMLIFKNSDMTFGAMSLKSLKSNKQKIPTAKAAVGMIKSDCTS